MNAKNLKGSVISNKMNKTIVVQTTTLVKHKQYHKHVKRFTKYYAHDENNSASMGDLVLIKPNRPISKLKRWTLESIITQHKS